MLGSDVPTKIFESGSAATALEFNASRREVDWQNFVSAVPSCASLAATDNTFDCLRAANSTEMFSGVVSAIANAPEEFGFDPTIDGPGGLFPDIASTFLKSGHFARLPFIAGTNLDEGMYIHPRNDHTPIITAFYRHSLHTGNGADRSRHPCEHHLQLFAAPRVRGFVTSHYR